MKFRGIKLHFEATESNESVKWNYIVADPPQPTHVMASTHSTPDVVLMPL
jgi:hypothetical protein